MKPAFYLLRGPSQPSRDSLWAGVVRRPGRSPGAVMRGGPVSRILLSGLPPQTTIPLGRTLPRGSSCQPGPLGPKPPCPDIPQAGSVGREVPTRHCSRWGLPSGRCCHPPGGLLPHRFTLTCRQATGGLFSVALSVRLPCPGVTRHRCFGKSGLSSRGFPKAAVRPSTRARHRRGGRAWQSRACRPISGQRRTSGMDSHSARASAAASGCSSTDMCAAPSITRKAAPGISSAMNSCRLTGS